jgi:hypothetical protein
MRPLRHEIRHETIDAYGRDRSIRCNVASSNPERIRADPLGRPRTKYGIYSQKFKGAARPRTQLMRQLKAVVAALENDDS